MEAGGHDLRDLDYLLARSGFIKAPPRGAHESRVAPAVRFGRVESSAAFRRAQVHQLPLDALYINRRHAARLLPTGPLWYPLGWDEKWLKMRRDEAKGIAYRPPKSESVLADDT